MYRVGKVTLSNFGPFEQASFDLDRSGVTVIEGIIEGVPGCTSNGSGKSYLLDSVAWCLFGRCVRPEVSGDAVVREDAGRDTSVEVVLNGEVPVTVRRYRRHRTYRNQVVVEVDGRDVSRGTDAQTQQVIESTLGMDFLTFCNSVAFGTREDIRSFFSATDSDRKRILETILGLELYAEAEKAARRKARELAELLSAAQAAQAQREVRLTSMKEDLATADEADVSDVKRRVKEAETNLETWQAKLKKRNKVLAAATQRLEDAEEAYEELLESWQTAVSKHAEKLDRAQEPEAELNVETLAARTAVSAAEHRIQHIGKMEGTDCPTCGQAVGAKHAKGVVAECERQLKDARAKLEKATKQQEAMHAKVQKLRQESPEKPNRPDDYSELQEAVEAADEKVSRAKQKISGYRAEVESLQRELGRAEKRKGDLKQRIDSLQAEYDEEEAALSQSRRKANIYQFWIEAFGNQGLKSYLIEAEIPEINRQATRYARTLLGGGAMVKLTAVTTLKSGDKREKMSVVGRIPGYAPTYAQASKGQKRRMDLALLLAFRRVVASRSSRAIDQLFADEIFDGLDPAGVDAIAELLREESSNGPIVMVTHDDRLRSVGDHLLTVRHTDGVARLEGGVTQSNPVVRKKKPVVKRRVRA